MARYHNKLVHYTVGLSLCSAILMCVLPAAIAGELPEGVMSEDAVLRRAALPWTADSTIAAMVAEISGDSIYAFIEKLSGEEPIQFDYGEYNIPSRYTPCRSSRMAADFLRMCFEEYGYTVDMHYYALPKLRTILLQPAGVSLMGGQWGHVFRTEDVSEWPRARDGIETLDGVLYGCDYVSGGRYVVVGGSGIIITSDDGGLSWTQRTSGVATRLEDVSILASGIGWAVGVSGTVLHTTDGGSSWAAQTSGVAEGLRDITVLDEFTAVAVGDAGRILRTIDGGLNWNPVTSGTASNLATVFFSGAVGWAAGATGTIIKTTDGGQTWGALTSGSTSNLKDIHFADADTGWAAGTTCEILMTTDGGSSWSSQTGPVPGATWTAVQAISSSEAWVVGYDFYGGHAARTTDGGSNWESMDTAVKGGTSNVVAFKTGTSAPEEEVILGGHYDSVPSDCDLAPGADDNGSGIGVIMEAARVMAESAFERTIKFVCFSGEEQGLYGSEAYAERAAAEGEQIIGMFNLDSVGWNDDYFRLFSDDNSDWLGDLALSMAGVYAPGLITYHWYCPSCTWSDHASFWQYGFGAIVGIETWDPEPIQHHTAGDTVSLLDRDLMANVARIAVPTIASVAGVDTTSSGMKELVEDVLTPRLSRVSPNPFSPNTTIEFSVAEASRVTVEVFDPSGRLVRRLLDTSMSAGSHVVTWSGTDDSGHEMGPGVYFYRIQAGALAETAKLVLTR